MPGRDGPRWPWRLLAAALILLASGLRLTFLLADCPLDLAPDEAHYWDWTRHPDWGYYSKGPLVAALIRAGDFLAGSWIGSATAAVRLPAVVCGALLLVSLYVLTVQTCGRDGLACGVVAAAVTIPAVNAGGVFITIDAPFTCSWGWALVLAHRAAFGRAAWAWPAAGAVVALGLLAKFTMALFVPCLALFLLATPSQRPQLRRPGFWALVAVAGLGVLPQVWWNARHDWVALRHVGGQVGLDEAGGARWLGPVRFLGEQGFAVLLGFWLVAWVGAVVAFRPGRDGDPRRAFLWWLSVPVFSFFAGSSLRTPGQLNWPVAAYLAGLVLAVLWLAERWRDGPRARRWIVGSLLIVGPLGVALTAALLDTRLVRPALERWAGPPTAVNPLPLRKLDPTARLRGWRFLAAEVDRETARLRAAGEEPVLAAAYWTLPGELAFYCDGHPTVYCLGPVRGERLSQYDLWRPNPVWDPEAFRGRTFLIVGELTDDLRTGFASLGPGREVWYCEGDQPIAVWTLTVGHGFRGFPGGPWRERLLY
jgi:4-amino-4-deoxy-L-arabinose transferase-like glycosyltransferase